MGSICRFPCYYPLHFLERCSYSDFCVHLRTVSLIGAKEHLNRCKRTPSQRGADLTPMTNSPLTRSRSRNKTQLVCWKALSRKCISNSSVTKFHHPATTSAWTP